MAYRLGCHFDKRNVELPVGEEMLGYYLSYQLVKKFWITTNYQLLPFGEEMFGYLVFLSIFRTNPEIPCSQIKEQNLDLTLFA